MKTPWRTVFELSPELPHFRDKHLADLLTGILLIVIGMAIITLMAQLLFVPNFGTTFTTNLVGVGLLCLTLIVARTRWFRGATVVALLLVQGMATIAALINPQDPVWWAYQVITVLLATLFLSRAQAAAIAGLVFATTIGVFTFNGFDHQHDAPPLMFLVVTLPCLVLVANRRGALEAWRAQSLERSRDALLQAEVAADLGHWEWADEEFKLSKGLQRLLQSNVHVSTSEFLGNFDEASRDQVESLLDSSQAAEIHVEIKGSSPRHARVVFEPRDEGASRLGVIHELTAQIEAAAASEALRARLLETERLEILAGIARGVGHDLNNLLFAIVGAAEALPLFPPDERGEIFEEIDAVVQRGAALTKQLTEFGVRADDDDAESASFGEIASVMQPILERLVGTDILTVQISDEARNRQVDVGRAELEQVLLNLVINARDAIDIGAGQRITVSLDVDDTLGRLVVADDGSGIAPEIVGHIFEPFFTSGKPAGTGVGLATVKDIVDRAGGTIDVSTQSGVGTSFSANLPLRR